MPVSRDDATLASPKMRELWSQTLDDAYWNVPTRPNWRFQKQGSVDKALHQLIWADAAVAPIGDADLPEIVSDLCLRRRLIAYTLIVEEASRKQTIELFNCTCW